MARPKTVEPRKPARKPTKKKPPPRKAAKPGRPPVFTEELLELVTNYCLLGATDEEMAGFLDISVVTFNAYKRRYPQFLKALKAGKEEADALVAKSLFHRARGYSHPEDDIRTVSLGGDAGSEIVITPTTKHYPPDATSAIFWLKNRQRNSWRDRTELTGADGGAVQVDTPEDGNLLNASRRLAFVLSEGVRLAKGKK